MARKIQKKKRSSKKVEIAVDTTPKRKRGRPGVRPSLVAGRAYNYGLQLEQVWKELEGPLVAAKTVDDVTVAFSQHAEYLQRFFVPGYAERILQVLREPRFPKRPAARIRFLADSLGGAGQLSARRSRDICAHERTKKVFKITRREYYVECSCGYKGPALNDACRECGAKISALPTTITWGTSM